MEAVKSRDLFFEPDPRSASFAKLDLRTGEGTPMTLDDQYQVTEHFRVHDGVPEDVRGYMATIVTLWLYGWLHYPFYTLTEFLSATAIEMALRHRFPKAGKDYRGLHALLRQARAAGFLQDESFPSLQHQRENEAQMGAGIGDFSGAPTEELPQIPYAERLIEFLPRIRNEFAHPKMHTIMFPGSSVDSLILAAEIINQLWPDPNKKIAEGSKPL
jgi:hypothetical protein